MDQATGERIGVMVCGHGSRSAAAVEEFAGVAAAIARRFPEWPVEHGYLEFANPVIADGLDRLRERGANRILAVPGMLFAAAHAKNDIPSVLNTYKARHGIRIDYGRELGVDPKMLKAAADRIAAASAALDRRHGTRPAADTCLVVVGRGASDPDANANVAKVARLLWEGFGFGWCETAYSGVTFPLVEPALEKVTRLGFPRVIVFPYFLFTGVLIDRIYGFTDRVAERHPEIAFAKAGYLGDHPMVVETFAERIVDIVGGEVAMNCQMCKYRAQVLGFEADVGAPQESHHHHVEGKGASAPGSTVADCPLCEDFCTGACRVTQMKAARDAGGHHHHDGHHHPHGHHHHDGGDGHHHHHHPYPHEDHPLGPVSVLERPAEEAAPAVLTDPDAITARSFEIIRREADFSRFAPDAVPLAERIVHASGMTDVVEDLRIAPGLAAATVEAIAAGRPVLVDARAVEAMAARRALPAGARIGCLVDAPEAAAEAARRGTTRSAAAVRLWGEEMAGAVVVIGNAPTALFELLAILEEGGPVPAAVHAFPVGFVGAAESKAALAARTPPFPFATLLGRRGGSAIAAASFNAAVLAAGNGR